MHSLVRREAAAAAAGAARLRGITMAARTSACVTALRVGGGVQRTQVLQRKRLFSLLVSGGRAGAEALQLGRSEGVVLPARFVLRGEFSTLGRWGNKDAGTAGTAGTAEKAKAKTEGEGGKGEQSTSSGDNTKDEKSQEQEQDKDKDKDKEKEKEKEKPPPPPPHGDKSPFQVFYETLQSEFKKSQEWQESTKQLADSAHQFTESPAVKRAREAYERSAEASGKVGKRTAEVLGRTAEGIGKGAAWTWNTPVVKAGRVVARKTGEGVAAATKPVRETKVYKDVTGNIKEVIDDGSSSRYGGYLEREERKRQRELRESKEGPRRAEKMEEDPKAGQNIVVHKDARWKESWRAFKENNKMMQSLFSLRRNMEASEHPLVNAGRSIADRFAGFFAENETALVIRKMRELDATFQLDPFLRELREYILPEVLDAYVKGDVDTLRAWLSAAQFNVYAELAKQYTKNGLRLDGKILDIRGVDVVQARILDPGDIPVFIVSCRTQEVHVYRDIKTGELKAGRPDRIQQVTYAIGITRLADEVANPETNGWRLIELQKSARDFI